MNDKDNAVYLSLERVNRFGAAHASAFSAVSIATTEFARGIVLARAIGPDDASPGNPASPATGARNHLFAEVWEDLKAIAATARTIGKKEPGFAVKFTLREDTHREILASATDFLAHLADPTTVAKFVAYALPATFVTDLRNDLTAIGDRGAEQTDDKIEDVGGTARSTTLIHEARDLIGSLNTSVRNRFRNSPEILAEWRTAARIHRTGGSGPEHTGPPFLSPS